MMFVIESGADKAGQWVAESRNLYEDYQKAFGTTRPGLRGGRDDGYRQHPGIHRGLLRGYHV